MNIEDCYLKAYKFLKNFGYFNDEQTKLSHQIQHEFPVLQKKMAELGYQGNLDKEAKVYPRIGAIYWVFDKDRLSIYDAIKLTDEHVKKNY